MNVTHQTDVVKMQSVQTLLAVSNALAWMATLVMASTVQVCLRHNNDYIPQGNHVCITRRKMLIQHSNSS